MPLIFVTLVGGSPWGFRIQGGRGTGQPLRLSKVNPGSKAFHQGLKEGDYLRMINGVFTDHLSQMDVQNIIKETGTHLTLEVERNPKHIDYRNLNDVKKRLVFNDSSVIDIKSQSSDATPKVAKPSNEITNTNNGSNSPLSTNTHNLSSDDSSKIQNCDFTNCIRPSKLLNSPFLAEISAKSSAPRYSPDPASQVIPSQKSPDVTSKDKQVGNCDFAHCLKPSQVQNSVFTAELSEITANKFCSDSSRTSIDATPNGNTIFMKEDPAANSKNEVQHRTELTIVLQPPSLDKLADTAEATENQSSAREDFPAHNKQPEDICPPPPPPPPPFSPSSKVNKSGWKISDGSCSLESQIQDRQAHLSKPIAHSIEIRPSPKTPVVLELEKKFEKQSTSTMIPKSSGVAMRSMSEPVIELPDLKSTEDKRYESNDGFRSHSPLNSKIYKADSNGFSPDERMKSPSLVNGKNDNYHNGSAEPSNTIITHEPPPPGAVLIDKRTTIDGDKVHTDKYYALPVKEVLKETTSTTRFIPAPPKYEGIGPTEDGIPIAPRNSVKKENMHNWYKTMYKSLHKADSSNDPQEYIIGYSSEPESNKKDKIMRKKSSTLDNRSSNNNDSKFNNNNFGYGYPPSAKSSIETYNVRPRLIEDYEPGHSSVTDDEITYGSKRYLPPMNVPKPSYEFKNGYEQDNHYTKKLVQPDPPSANQQKKWYNEIQHGGEVPQCGLGKPAPEKIQEPSIGPLPHPPLNYNGPTVPTQGTRPLTLPSEYAIVNENGLCQQQNGAYEIQMRQVIHSELHQRLSPSSSQLSSPTRSILKSPCRSPDLKIPARALFDFRPESPKEVSLKKGDNVLILRQLDKNWYEGEKQGIVGIFPISYIEVVPPEHASLPQSSFEGMGKVLYDFTAHTSIELSVKKHDMITLLRRVDSNWYEAKLQNRKGIVPASYLQVLQEPLEKRTPLSSPNSLISSSGSRPTSREGILKTVTPSSSQISPIHSTSAVVTNGRSNMQSRGKKSSNLIEPVMYRAIYSYSPQNTDELELAEGDTVYVVEMCDDGWYVGTSVRTGIFGIFPGNYVEKV